VVRSYSAAVVPVRRGSRLLAKERESVPLRRRFKEHANLQRAPFSEEHTSSSASLISGDVLETHFASKPATIAAMRYAESNWTKASSNAVDLVTTGAIEPSSR